MLIELAYNVPLQELQLPDDDQGDAHTHYWTARRIGEDPGFKTVLGSKYAEAVLICLHCSLGASNDLEDSRAQQLFYIEVVQKFKRAADAVNG